jgi:predicted acyl esterase
MASATYPALSEGVTFSTAPWKQDVEIVGPMKAKLFVSSSTRDMDIFATVCAFDPQGEEMTFIAAPEPKSPVTQGWLRVSQRKLDPQRSTEYLPYYPHDERQLLEPGETYEVDLEIWPMGLALPKGSRLTLTIQGKDFERPGATGPLRGVAWFTHEYRRAAPILSFVAHVDEACSCRQTIRADDRSGRRAPIPYFS